MRSSDMRSPLVAPDLRIMFYAGSLYTHIRCHKKGCTDAVPRHRAVWRKRRQCGRRRDRGRDKVRAGARKGQQGAREKAGGALWRTGAKREDRFGAHIEKKTGS